MEVKFNGPCLNLNRDRTFANTWCYNKYENNDELKLQPYRVEG